MLRVIFLLLTNVTNTNASLITTRQSFQIFINRWWRSARNVISPLSSSCFLPCWGRGRCWRLVGRTESQGSFREAVKKWGTARVSTVRRERSTTVFCSCWICHRTGAEKCRPVVSLARAGPSRPGRCWSTTQRSYLMTTVPPLEALYFPPLLEVRRPALLLSIFVLLNR